MTDHDRNRPSDDDAKANAALAKKRFAVLNLVRLVGLGVVLLGIAISQGATNAPPALGIVLALSGLVAFFFLPKTVAKGWRSDAE